MAQADRRLNGMTPLAGSYQIMKQENPKSAVLRALHTFVRDRNTLQRIRHSFATSEMATEATRQRVATEAICSVYRHLRDGTCGG